MGLFLVPFERRNFILFLLVFNILCFGTVSEIDEIILLQLKLRGLILDFADLLNLFENPQLRFVTFVNFQELLLVFLLMCLD